MHITLAWREGDGKRRRELFVPSRQSTARHYIDGPPWRSFDTREEAAWFAFQVRSRVAFVDGTGLRQSVARGPLQDIARLAGRNPYARRHGFDHTSTWYMPEPGRGGGGWLRSYLITTEPYDDGVEVSELCRRLGLDFHVCRPGLGLWNPPGTRLVLVAPPRRGLPIAQIIPAVENLLPVRTRESVH